MELHNHLLDGWTKFPWFSAAGLPAASPVAARAGWVTLPTAPQFSAPSSPPETSSPALPVTRSPAGSLHNRYWLLAPLSPCPPGMGATIPLPLGTPRPGTELSSMAFTRFSSRLTPSRCWGITAECIRAINSSPTALFLPPALARRAHKDTSSKDGGFLGPPPCRTGPGSPLCLLSKPSCFSGSDRGPHLFWGQ